MKTRYEQTLDMIAKDIKKLGLKTDYDIYYYFKRKGYMDINIEDNIKYILKKIK